MKPRLPLNNLNTFAAAAEHLSFQAAARDLHVTPSAVSHQVRNLEGLLGYTLFDRIDKGVRLTARGRELFDRIHEPLRHLQEAAEAALRAQDDRTLTVSAAPVFATRWLIPRLGSYRREHPDISLSVIATTDLLEFRANNIDCAIRIGPGDWTNANTELLFRPRIAAVCAHALVEGRDKLFDVEELRTQKRVENLGMPGLWDRWFASAGVQVPKQKAALQVQSAAQVLESLQADDCVGLFDLNLIKPEIDDGQIRLACHHIFEEGDGYYFVLPTDRDISPAENDFRDWVRDQVEKA